MSLKYNLSFWPHFFMCTQHFICQINLQRLRASISSIEITPIREQKSEHDDISDQTKHTYTRNFLQLWKIWLVNLQNNS